MAIRDSPDISTTPSVSTAQPGFCPEPGLGDKNPKDGMFCCKRDPNTLNMTPTNITVAGAVEDLCTAMMKTDHAFGRTGLTKKAEAAYKEPDGFRAIAAIEYNTDLPTSDCQGKEVNEYDYGECEAKFKRAFADDKDDLW